MMLSVLSRAIIIMVVIIRATRQCMMHVIIRHTSMLQRHMPGGKEPAEQRQQSEDATV